MIYLIEIEKLFLKIISVLLLGHSMSNKTNSNKCPISRKKDRKKLK